MNRENVSGRFQTLADLDSGEMLRWHSLVDDACAYVEARCRVKNPDSAQSARLEMLAAAYALRLYELWSGESIKQLVAGDIRMTLADGNQESRGERLWQLLCADCAELIDSEGFKFGVI